MNWPALQGLLMVWAVASAMMLASWWHWRRGGKAGCVDVVWAFGVGLGGVAAAIFVPDAHPWRRGLAALAIGAWSLRLGTMLRRRVLAQSEDGRYAAMIRHFGRHAPTALFVFFQAQALWVVLFVFPIAASLVGNTSAPDWAALAALALAVAAIAGEALADAELARFRSRPESKGRVCREGLWAWSRHPNYFFEWVFWWAFVLLGLGGPAFLWTLLGPTTMGLFLFRVTGIPFTEKQALASRGEAYRDYQRTTSVFVPWPPRRTPS